MPDRFVPTDQLPAANRLANGGGHTVERRDQALVLLRVLRPPADAGEGEPGEQSRDHHYASPVRRICTIYYSGLGIIDFIKYVQASNENRLDGS